MWSLLSRAALLLPLFQSGDETDKGSRPVSLTGILGPDGDGKYWIHSAASNSDTGQPVLSAAFVPYGASLTNLIFHDRWGIARDIVAGFENASYYSIDKTHAHLNGVPGRYANRIRNSSFVLDGRTVHVRPNENPTAEHPEGVDTLHGGPNGWDWRNFTVIAHDENSISFELVDLDGAEGFPGEVVAFVTYALTGTSTWDIKMVAVSTQQRTPIMLSSHTYWNLDGFGNNETRLALNHSLHMPDARRRVGVDSILVPTGELLANDEDSVNDFWSAPRQLGKGFESPGIKDNCGLGCSGYDNCFLIDRDETRRRSWRRPGSYVARLRSAWSGIQLDVYTDQEAMQLYSCNFQDDTMPLKSTQGVTGRHKEGFRRTIPQYGCVVLEVQDWIDGINHPEWKREHRQIFGLGDAPYVLQASYEFSINTTAL